MNVLCPETSLFSRFRLCVWLILGGERYGSMRDVIWGVVVPLITLCMLLYLSPPRIGQIS